MRRTQIQLPDELFEEAKRLCEEREISFAELARRGVEHMMRVLNPGGRDRAWQPPEPRALGWSGLSEEELKDLAQETSADDEFRRR